MIHYDQGAIRFYSLIAINLGSAVYSMHCLVHGLVSAVIAVVVSTYVERDELERLWRHPSVYFNGFASCLSFLLVFRANLSYQRYWEARTRITQLVSKLRDVAIQVATFVQANEGEAASWKSTQLRRLALYNRLALAQVACTVDLGRFVKEGVLTPEELPVIEASGNKAALVMVWLTDAWVTRQMKDGFDVPPPVLTRSFQLLSEAALERDQIQKIKDTPFPFPFAQVCSLMLFIWCLTLPMVLATFVTTVWAAALSSFCAVVALFSVNAVASELESPFDDTPNDLCLEYIADHFTDTIAELMAWLAHRSAGNVAGSIGDEPVEKPWAMMEKQMQLHRELSNGEKDFVQDNPAGASTGGYNFIPEEVRMRVTKRSFQQPKYHMSTLDSMSQNKSVFWLH